jgi:signal transduction histidine kinase
MPFNQVSSSFYPYLYMGAFAGLIFCALIFFFTDRYVVKGEVQKRIHFLVFYMILGYLLLALPVLPLDEEIRNIFRAVTFSWFASFPVLIYGVLVYPDDFTTRKFPVFLLAIPVIALAPAFPGLHPYLLLFVFIPGWLGSSTAVFLLYTNTVNPDKRRMLFHTGFAVIIAGAGFLMDNLLVSNYQEIPLLTIFFPVWSLWIISNNSSKFTDGKDEPTAGDGVKYILVPVIILSALAFQKGLIFLLRDEDAFQASGSGHFMLMVVTALIMMLLYNRLSSTLSGFADKLSERYLSTLAQDLVNPTQSGLYDRFPANLPDWLSRYSDVSLVVWMRSSNSREFRPISSKIPTPFNKKDVLIFEDSWLDFFSRRKYSLLNPKNIETLSSSQQVFSKIVSLVERGEVLVTFCGYEDTESLPYMLLTFFRKAPAILKPAEIRDFGKLSEALNTEAEKFWKKSIKKPLSLPSEAVKAKTIQEMTEALRQNTELFFPGIKPGVVLLISDEKGVNWTFHLLSGNILNEELPPPDSLLPEKPDVGGLYHVKSGNKNFRILPVKTTSVKALLAFAPDETKFVYEMEDRETLEKIANTFGVILERIITLEKFNSQTQELNSVVEQAEIELKKQRQMVAENIHDTVAQEIFAARMQIDLLQRELREASPETKEELNLLRETVSDGLKHVRKLIHTLNSAETEIYQTCAESEAQRELFDFLERVKKETGMKIRTLGLDNLSFPNVKLSAEISMIIREAVNNIRKHADADNVIIRLKRKKIGFSILIIDNGKGFDLSELFKGKDMKNITGEKFGLKSILSRCERSNCKMKIKTSPGKGTIVMVTG